MFHQKLAKFFSSDVGIDLGTANCLIYVKDAKGEKGMVLSEPSVVAIDANTEEVVAVGKEAARMLDRCPLNIRAIRPMQRGTISEVAITKAMLRYFIDKAKLLMPPCHRMIKPRVLVAVPSGITDVESQAVKDSAKSAGAREVFLIEEPMAAAIGVGLPTSEPVGNMIVDIGGGTTEVAVISLGGVVTTKSSQVGGDNMNNAIVQHMKRAYNLLIGEPTAEKIKIEIGSAHCTTSEETYMEVKGRDQIAGLPKAIKVSSSEIRAALQEPVTSIVEAVRTTLERCPPEMAGDLIERGIMLSGGGSLLRGLSDLLTAETGLPVFVADEPLKAVVNGTGIVLQELDSMLRSLRAG